MYKFSYQPLDMRVAFVHKLSKCLEGVSFCPQSQCLIVLSYQLGILVFLKASQPALLLQTTRQERRDMCELIFCLFVSLPHQSLIHTGGHIHQAMDDPTVIKSSYLSIYMHTIFASQYTICEPQYTIVHTSSSSGEAVS